MAVDIRYFANDQDQREQKHIEKENILSFLADSKYEEGEILVEKSDDVLNIISKFKISYNLNSKNSFELKGVDSTIEVTFHGTPYNDITSPVATAICVLAARELLSQLEQLGDQTVSAIINQRKDRHFNGAEEELVFFNKIFSSIENCVKPVKSFFPSIHQKDGRTDIQIAIFTSLKDKQAGNLNSKEEGVLGYILNSKEDVREFVDCIKAKLSEKTVSVNLSKR